MLSWILLAALAVPVVYLLLLYQLSYWKRRGVVQLNPTIPFGDAGQFFRQRSCLGVMFWSLYEQTRTLPFVGIYNSFRPALLVNDQELVKDILVRDFDHFHDRGLHVNEKKDPLSGHLFALGGEKWKHHRSKLTPTFTSGRMKEMFPILVQIGTVLQDHIDRRSATEGVLEIREIMARYTTDIIASVGFGIQIDSINNSDEAFRHMGGRVFAHTVKNSLRLASTFLVPKLKALLGFKFLDQEVEDFMLNVVRDTLEHRESKNVIRKDMMQLLLQLRNSGTVAVDGQWNLDTSSSHKKLSLEQVAAHAFVFFAAAYETSSTAISFSLYELAKNIEIQRKVQREIDEVLSRSNGALTYENIIEMKYLESCIDETLRKYPSVPFLNRECTKNYTIAGTNVNIEKGTSVIIPIMGMQRDPVHFVDPERYDPERFNGAHVTAGKPYLPFGTGPRVCIGLRLGKLQTKVGLVMVLSKFRLQMADAKQINEQLKLDSRSLILMPVGGINVVVTRRNVT